MPRVNTLYASQTHKTASPVPSLSRHVISKRATRSQSLGLLDFFQILIEPPSDVDDTVQQLVVQLCFPKPCKLPPGRDTISDLSPIHLMRAEITDVTIDIGEVDCLFLVESLNVIQEVLPDLMSLMTSEGLVS
jgi:hypothetical protein